MQSNWSIALIAVLITAVWILLVRADRLDQDLTACKTARSSVLSLNSEQAALITRQNEEILHLREASQAAEVSASDAATQVLAGIPAKVEQDRSVPAEPKEMNEWMRALFR